jgi:hypothetical protein
MGSRDRRRVLLTPDAATFSEHVGDLLQCDPIGTNVIATVLAGVRAGHPQPSGSLWVAISDADRPTGVALLTAGYPPWLAPMPADDAEALAETLHRHGLDVPLVRGDAAAVTAFAARWQRLTGCTGRQVTAEGIRVLDTFVPPLAVLGSPRTATVADEPLIADWYTGFEREARPAGDDADDDAVRRRVAMFLRRLQTDQIVLWTDGGGVPVSLAGWQLPDTPGGLATGRIGPVWTPPEHRRRGYAAAVTAEATRAVLAAGAAQVMLYTDLANPTSNGVYARLGYRLVGAGATWSFRTQPGGPAGGTAGLSPATSGGR